MVMKLKTVGLLGLFICLLSGCVNSRIRPLEVLGEVETVRLLAEGLVFPARIDTGATTSSVSAQDITPVEEDGENWVSFRLPPTEKGGKTTLVKRKVERVVKVKRHGGKSMSRYVVKLRVQIGDIDDDFEFTLVDRSGFVYPVLIGRNILRGRAVVDVRHKNAAGKTLEIHAE